MLVGKKVTQCRYASVHAHMLANVTVIVSEPSSPSLVSWPIPSFSVLHAEKCMESLASSPGSFPAYQCCTLFHEISSPFCGIMHRVLLNHISFTFLDITIPNVLIISSQRLYFVTD